MPQVVGHEQGGSHDGPHGHLSHRLVPAQPEVPNHQLGQANKKFLVTLLAGEKWGHQDQEITGWDLPPEPG